MNKCYYMNNRLELLSGDLSLFTSFFAYNFLVALGRFFVFRKGVILKKDSYKFIIIRF